MSNPRSVWAATLMVAGLCIGGAMIGLPISLVGLGLWGSMLMLLACWGLMTYTALLTYEVNTAFPPGCHFLTMASKTLGIPGKIVTSVCYMVLLYALVAAYLTASSEMINELFSSVFTDHLGVAMLLTLSLVVGMLATGTTNVAKCNRYLMFVLLGSFIFMVIVLAPEVNEVMTSQPEWNDIPVAGVVALTSFGFHILIPTLRVYTQGNQQHLIKAIIGGSAIALFIYCIWVFVSMGSVSPETLTMIRDGDIGSAKMLDAMFDGHTHPFFSVVGHCFVLLAVLTSFIGVLVSLVDFLADSLSIKNKGIGRPKLIALALLPPLVFTLFYPHGFVVALTYAGIMVAILHGILPVLMVWRVRKHALPTDYQTPGKQWALLFVLLASMAVIFAEFLEKWS